MYLITATISGFMVIIGCLMVVSVVGVAVMRIRYRNIPTRGKGPG